MKFEDQGYSSNTTVEHLEELLNKIFHSSKTSERPLIHLIVMQQVGIHNNNINLRILKE